MDSVVDRALAAWPDAAWNRREVEDRWRRLRSAEPSGDRHWDDLFLAWACLAKDARALRTIESRYIADTLPNLKHMALAAHECDEVLQQLRERLLVGTGNSQPALERYTGRGHLGGFIRTTAVRLAVDLRRATRPPPDELSFLVAHADADPELSYIRKRYAAELEQAVRAAFASLADKQRLLLRHQLVDALSVDQIAALYRIHRATAARRCAAARARLCALARRELRAQLGVGNPTVDSILRIVTGGIDARVLHTKGS